MFNKVKQFLEEKKGWDDAGQPYRSEEKIQELFNICIQCPEYQKVSKKVGKCGVCGCRLSYSSKFLNKLAWATTRCPLDEPKWIEDIKLDEQAPAETPVETQTEEPPKPAPKIVRGCGCGS